MYIEKLTIKNFRCFDQQKMDFNWPGYAELAGKETLRLPNVNLLIGSNGVGKTTIFQALAVAPLSPYLEDNVSGFRTPRAIRHDEASAEASATLLLSPQDLSASPTGADQNVPVTGHTMKCTISHKGSGQSLRHQGRKPIWIEHQFLDEHPGFFIAAYGAGRRTEQPEAYVKRNISVRYARIISLFEPDIGMMPLSLAYEQCKKRGQWDNVVEIVNRLLSSNPASPVQLTKDRHNDTEPIFNYEGIALPVSELSDGYRLFVGWVIDFLTHLAMVLPIEAKLTEAVGVVIVDEVDLFLSPSWQRTVLESLSNTFPNIQWFCSTHSALVAGSVDSENIFMLERSAPYTSRVRRPTNAFEGKSVEKVLTELFNVQQPRSTELQRQLSVLAEKAMHGDVEASIEYLRRLHAGTAQK